MNNQKKKRIINVLVLMLVIDLIALTFLYVSTKNFLEISKEAFALKTVTSQTINQTPTVITQEPLDDNKLEAIARQHNIVDVKSDTTVSRSSSPDEKIDSYVRTITSKYSNVAPELVMSIIYHESRYNPKAKVGACVGLMQISTYWHSDRASKLGVTNFYDPYGNILLGVDYLSELFNTYKDPALVLMMYNMNHDDALALYKRGVVSPYAKSVLSRAEKIRKGE